jgi:excisionase family DNA binding protein
VTALRLMTPPTPPTQREAELARSSSRQIAALLGEGDAARLQVHDGAEVIEVPVAALRMLVAILNNMAEGRAVNILPANAELTTQQAADLLNVSRPYLVTLLETNALPFHMAGTHRRINAIDVMQYRAARDSRNKAALDELAAQAQELNMGY